MKQNKHLLNALRLATVASALALAIGAAMAQGPISGAPGMPRVDLPNQRPDNPGGGGGIGINIDLGSIFNAIRNATRKDQPDKEDPKKPPLLQKSAVAITSGSSGNYVIDWVVQYANNTGATLPAVLVKDGPIATIIPGSLQPPPIGWTATTNSSPPVDNFALWTGTNIASHGVMTATIAAMPSSAPLSGASGDGYGPIPYTHSQGLRIYLLNHHLSHTAQLFDCIDAATKTRCATKAGGTPWPRNLPQGEANLAKTSGSLTSPEPLISGSKMYYAWNHLAEGYGLGCFDLETEQPCGKVAFISAQTSPKSALSGPWKINNNLYYGASTGQLYCVDISSLGNCSGLSAVAIPLNIIKLKATQYDVAASGQDYGAQPIAASVVGARLYITSQVIDKNGGAWVIGDGIKHTNCFDNTTKSACWTTHASQIGFPGTADVGHISDAYANRYTKGYLLNLSNFIYYSSNGAAVAICQLNDAQVYDTTNGQHCVKLSDGKNATLSEIPNMWISSPNVLVRTQKEVHIWPKTYFTESRENKVFCWDWSTGSKCNSSTSFAENGVRRPVPGFTDNYAMKEDEQGCIWVYGDSKHLWNFNPNNLDINGKPRPCGGGNSTSIFQPLKYCSGPKPFRWTSVEVKGAPLPNYSKFIVKVLDSLNNTVLFIKDLKATSQLQANITGIDLQTISRPLKIEIEYIPNPGMGASDQPYLEVRYNAPPTEFCFKSTHTCEQKKITNFVETPDPATPGKFISVTVNVERPKDCKTPPPAVCGDPGQPPCPTCGQPGQPPCPDPVCIPGTPGCPDIIGCVPGTPGCPRIFGCVPGDPRCTPVRPPPNPVCLTGNCPDKPTQSIAEEFKEPKVVCARKTKPVENTPKKVVIKPKPAVVATAPADSNASPKLKPKPRPKPAVKPTAQDDDC